MNNNIQTPNDQNKYNKTPIQVDYDHDIDRFTQIKSEFMVIDRDGSGFLSREEIEEYLKSKMGAQYNHEIVLNIFSQIDSDSDNKIAMEEYSHMYIWFESDLKNKIIELEKAQNLLKEEKQKLNTKLNSQSKPIDSYVKITLIQANINKAFEKLNEADKSKLSVKAILTCDNVKENENFARNTSPCHNITNPVWNENFTFNLDLTYKPSFSITIKFVRVSETQNQEVQQLQLQGTTSLTQSQVNQNQIQSTNVVSQQTQAQFGESLIQIFDVDKEIYFKEWRDIYDAKENTQKIGTAQFQLNYIYSEEIHLKNKLKEIDQKLQQLQKEITPKQEEYEYVNVLFGTISHQSQVVQKQIKQKKRVDDEDDDIFQTFALTQTKTRSILNEFDFHETEKYRDYGLIIMIIFLFFVSMERSDFLGLILVLRGLPFWGKKWTKSQNKFFSYGLLFSALMDIIWLYIFSTVFASSDTTLVTTYSWLMSFFLMIFKLLFVSYIVRNENIEFFEFSNNQ